MMLKYLSVRHVTHCTETYCIQVRCSIVQCCSSKGSEQPLHYRNSRNVLYLEYVMLNFVTVPERRISKIMVGLGTF